MNQPFDADYIAQTDQEDGLLRRSFDQVQQALEAGLIATWFWDVVPDKLFGDTNLLTLFGIDLKTGAAGLPLHIFTDAIHPDDRSQVLDLIATAQQTGQTFEADCRIITTRASTRWVVARGQFAYNPEKQPLTFSGVLIDVTNRRQKSELRTRTAEEQLTTSRRNELLLEQRVQEQTWALEQQAHQLRTTLDASLNSIIAMTALRNDQDVVIDFRMDMANKAVITSVFKTPEDLVGQTLLTVFPGNIDNGLFDLYKRVFDTGQAEQDTQYYVDQYGLEGWFEVSAVKQGQESLVITYNNITGRKQAELATQQQARQLEQLNAELKRSNESLQQFAHIASHDLQEPLRRIQSFSDLLKSQFADNLSDGERDMVQRIQKSAQRMQLLIKDLLTYSQLSRQRESFTQVPLITVLDDVVTDLELTITEKKATINVTALPDVLGNASRLRQLFQNLITNSLKFVPADALPIVQINARPARADELPESLQNQSSQAFWLITVTDNGIGFDEQYKDRIFSPFQRLHNPSLYSGTGMGLAICQRVVQNHGGAIDVSSQVGKGTTFNVFLPTISD